MKKTITYLCYSLLVVLILQACDNGNSATDNNKDTTTETAPDTEYITSDEKSSNDKNLKDFKPTDTFTPPPAFEAKDMLYTWVDKLNLRENPDLNAKVITTVDSDEAVEVIGDKSNKRSTYVLRGVAYVDHWYKVKTKAGDEGWIFGGAVKRKNEKKGNAPITEMKFDFPYFGSFDLSEWKNKGTKVDPETETDIETTVFETDDRILEFTEVDRGEYYYGYIYKLMDSNKKVLKQRNFDFWADVDYGELKEEVRDFSTDPATVYYRTQELGRGFYKLNARPMMAYGAWKQRVAEATENASGEEIAELYKLIEGGGDIKLKNRIYHLDRTIIITDEEDVTLDGNGSELIMMDKSADVIKVQNSNFITLKNFKATHVYPKGPLGCTGNVIQVNTAGSIRIEGCELNGSGIIGVVAYGARNLSIVNNIILANSRYGVLYDDGCILEISGNIFENNGENGKKHVAKGLDAELSQIEDITGDVNRKGLEMSNNVFK